MASSDRSWEEKQKKVFTKWVNYHLGKRGLAIENIDKDFEDGVKLINLYEQISGESLGKYNKAPKMRVHKINNLNIVLRKVNEFVGSVGIKTMYSAEQIVDCDTKGILGMTWVLIHKFAIQEVSEEELSAREGLLLWCQKVTKDYYPKVNITNFYSSWEDGLAFAAIIHKHRPDLINFDSMSKDTKESNLETSFDVASNKLGIPRLLDVEDFKDVSKSDEKAIMTYVAYYWKTFASSKKAQIAGTRIGNFSDRLQKNDQLASDYEKRAADLVQWIKEKTEKYSTDDYGNNLPEVQGNYDSFQSYKEGEKVNKTSEKNEVEALLTSLLTKQKAEKSPLYQPQITPAQLNELWDNLNKVENIYDAGIREALKRQKYLDALLRRFRAKAAQLTSWIGQKEKYLDEDPHTESVSAAQSKLKQLDSYDNEYAGQVKVFDRTNALGQEIVDAKHHESPSVVEAMEALKRGREVLAEKAAKRREILEKDLLYLIFRENYDTLSAWISEKKPYLESEIRCDSVASANQQLKMMGSYEYEYQAVTTNFDSTNEAGQNVINRPGHEKAEEVTQLLAELQQTKELLEELARTRREKLEHARKQQMLLAEFNEKFQEIKSWCGAKEQWLSKDPAIDSINTAQSRLRTLDAFDKEYSAVSQLFDSCMQLADQIEDKSTIDEKIQELDALRQKITELSSNRRNLITAELKRRQEVDAKLIQFSKLAEEFCLWADESLDFLEEAVFASSVDDVARQEAEATKIEETIPPREESLGGITALSNELSGVGLTENPYTRYTIEDCKGKFGQVKDLMEKKKKDLAVERERQEKNAAMLNDFTEKATQFQQWCEQQKQDLEQDLPGTLEEQIAALKEKMGHSINEGQQLLNGVIDVNNELAKANVAELAGISIQTLQVLFDNLKNLFSKKIQVIEERVIAEKATGITPEQLAEYRQAFDHFDKNKDGSLDRLEFKACLASVGQDLTDPEIDAVIRQVDRDGDGRVSLDEFVQYMVNKEKTGDSYEDILDSFRTIAGGNDFITEAQLRSVLNKEKADYLLERMPKTADGTAYDYKKYVDESFPH